MESICDSPETILKLCLYTEFPHQEIRLNYGIFRCDSHMRLLNICVTNQTNVMVKVIHFNSKKIGHTVIPSGRRFLIFKRNSELLEARDLKSSKESNWYHIGSLTSVEFFDLDSLFIKGEIPECSPDLNLKWQRVSP